MEVSVEGHCPKFGIKKTITVIYRSPDVDGVKVPMMNFAQKSHYECTELQNGNCNKYSLCPIFQKAPNTK